MVFDTVELRPVLAQQLLRHQEVENLAIKLTVDGGIGGGNVESEGDLLDCAPRHVGDAKAFFDCLEWTAVLGVLDSGDPFLLDKYDRYPVAQQYRRRIVAAIRPAAES